MKDWNWTTKTLFALTMAAVMLIAGFILPTLIVVYTMFTFMGFVILCIGLVVQLLGL